MFEYPFLGHALIEVDKIKKILRQKRLYSVR